jgi:hypothetical protein
MGIQIVSCPEKEENSLREGILKLILCNSDLEINFACN